MCVLLCPGLCVLMEGTEKIILHQIGTSGMLLRPLKSQVPEKNKQTQTKQK